MTKCKGCPIEFEPSVSRNGEPKRFCSDRCRTAYWTAKKHGWIGRRRPDRAERQRWQRRLALLKTLGEERADEVIRLALAEKAVSEL